MRVSKNTLLALSASAGMLLLSAPLAFAVDPTPNVVIKPPSSIGVGDISFNNLIAFVINAIIVLGIILSLIFLLYGGVRWIISGGDKAKVDSARSTIVAAIVGLIIVILAWVIINAVLSILGAGSLSTGFNVPHLNGGTPNPT